MALAGNGESAQQRDSVIDLTMDPETPAASASAGSKRKIPAAANALSRIEGDILKQAKMIAVLDTNYLLVSLSLIQSLTSISLKYGLVVIVPWVVIQELDGLKTSRSTNEVPGLGKREVGFLARSANRYLDDELGRSDSSLRCQRRTETLNDEAENDDKILDCCMYFLKTTKLPVTILSMDRSLSIKARIHGCTTCGAWDGDAAGLVSAIRGFSQDDMTPLRRKLANVALKPAAGDTQSAAAPAQQLRPRKIVQPKLHTISKKIRPKLPTIRPLSTTTAPEAAEASLQLDSQQESGTDSAEEYFAKRTRPNNTTSAHQRKAAKSPVVRRLHSARDRGHRYSTSTPKPSSMKKQSTATRANTSSPDGRVLGRWSGEFTFFVPSPVSNGKNSRHLSQADSMSRQQSDVVCISDSDGEGMDVDTAAGINRDTPPAATHIQPNTPRQAQKRTRTDGEAGDGNDGPVLIYLDDTPDKETARAKNAVVGKSALGISREIASYLCSSSCSLTELLTERFQKGGISSTYAESWSTILQRRFELPPWRSSTVIFTIMLSYWDALKQVFPRDLAGDIRRALPWVMFIENVPKCPQTKRPLTSDLHVSPFTYSKNSGPCTDLFKNEARQAGERKARTIELIHLARRILAQCELNETDAQERRRMQVTKEWAAWSKLNE